MMNHTFTAPLFTRTRKVGGAIRACLRVGKTMTRTACLCSLFLGGSSLQASSADLYQELAADDGLALFANAVEQAGLSESLKGDGPFTLFVPSDQAMVNEGSAFLLKGVLLTKPAAEHLSDLVLHHIVPDRRLTPDQLNGIDLPSLADVPLRVDQVGKGIVVGGWAVVTDQKTAENGIIYVIDRLLWPRDWQSSRGIAEHAHGHDEATGPGRPEIARTPGNASR